MPVPLPPDSRSLYRHGMMPEISHDESARINALASLNASVAATLSSGVRLAYEHEAAPKLTADDLNLSNPKAKTGAIVRKAIQPSPIYQSWASLRRAIQEMNRQTARHITIRQLDALRQRATALNHSESQADNTLQLNPSLEVPHYLAKADNHLQPGGYHTEIVPGDMTAAATYDIATFVTAMGMFGAKGDSGGRGMAKWLAQHYPDFKPKRILDIGSAHGNNTLPLAAAFPDAEVVALDAGAPMLRYGHARARSMGFSNVRFVQGAAEDIDESLGTFDWIQTTMVFHETSGSALPKILERIYAALNAGGLTLNLEQPNFTPETPIFDRFLRNWDAWYNNEPFWVQLHGMDFQAELQAAGFSPEQCIEGGVNPDLDPGHYPAWAGKISRHDHEHAKPKPQKKGYNGEAWYLFGARK
ncbi:MAG: class I SAM-dependent methyltransferase [Rhodospirillaceae bacterium]|jgi:ubiquinone/menaquinone biosynthesis C-methylase UbiE|nr:class I SAM-dependent methyltransferase [Rhodospirillaceae bacterium]MBT5566397.1 class I SAM-dependent methyltransferase [Rhodospirillaceae bacterium]MBT7450861.1 class I SAM-dependent methyltransferase [Rhodospirillaceae bacterium]